MNATTVAIDLAKDVFELALSDVPGEIKSRKRLRRSQLARAFDNARPMTIATLVVKLPPMLSIAPRRAPST